MKIVNRASHGNEKVSRGRLRVDEIRSPTRTNDISSSFSRKHSVTIHVAFPPVSHFFFFFHESVKRAQFRRGIFIGVDSPTLYPFVTVPFAFCREFFIQTMLKYILCMLHNTAKIALYTKTRKSSTYSYVFALTLECRRYHAWRCQSVVISYKYNCFPLKKIYLHN